MSPSSLSLHGPHLHGTALAVAIAISVSGCASVEEFSRTHSRTTNCLLGGTLGALTGAAAGVLSNKGDGAIIGGALLGAAAGCGAALAYKDRIDRLQRLAEEEHLKVDVETLNTSAATASAAPQEAGFVAQVQDQGMFPVGSAQLSVEGERQVRKLASAFTGQRQTAILVVGHTDATGNASFNQQLSERRARAVASILAEQGIAPQRMYFQGAGASRPVADNADPMQRGKNRRVEFVEVNDTATLVKRVNAEQNNPKYLAHGTATVVKAPTARSQPKPAKASKPAVSETVARKRSTQPVKPVFTPHSGPVVDFGGTAVSASQWTLGQTITPKSGGFSLVSSAYASSIPVSSCEADQPRESGKVINLASGQALDTHLTTDYLPGYNNRVWAQTVNGHLVTISPVSILRVDAAVDRQPFIQVVTDYSQGNRKALVKADAVANTYEGEDRVLYRVFLKDPQAPVSCMDVVFSKGSAQATDGALFYPLRNGETYIARFVPVRT
ncbi:MULTISPECIES: OmpA family protein [unclassified Pseudomonas]|uniref:OmpA family protein n=1 Tax=unclassified Pseudomonas TaxID=196821 RepID=UPI0021BA68EA|nr:MULTISPECIES: OmpA family protein [unclassified Pseudomonas]MCT8166720.1 OmpA family protein [Pseudomonas sp. HD6422]MCT8185589.1 OmpA family protein [Pseudomonas sp. HD6421]